MVIDGRGSLEKKKAETKLKKMGMRKTERGREGNIYFIHVKGLQDGWGKGRKDDGDVRMVASEKGGAKKKKSGHGDKITDKGNICIPVSEWHRSSQLLKH